MDRRLWRFAIGLLTTGLLCGGGSSVQAREASGLLFVTNQDLEQKAPECAVAKNLRTGNHINIWLSVRLPSLVKHCHFLHRGYDALRAMRFRDALDYALAAETELSGKSGPLVLRAMTYARWTNHHAQAIEAFTKVNETDSTAFDDAEVLDEYAVTLVRMGKLDEARSTYRKLLPRIQITARLCTHSTCAPASLAYFSAGMLAFDGGDKSAEEAKSILRELRTASIGNAAIQGVATLALALLLDRQRTDALTVRSENAVLSDIRADYSRFSETVPIELRNRMVNTNELLAMHALALEWRQAKRSVALWEQYLRDGDARYEAHAKAHATYAKVLAEKQEKLDTQQKKEFEKRRVSTLTGVVTPVMTIPRKVRPLRVIPRPHVVRP